MIHITLVRTDIDEMLLARLDTILTLAEQARAARFRRMEDRRRHVVARTVLKTLLAEQLACDPRDVRLETGVHGKPVLTGASMSDGIGAGTPLHFNLSHSGDLALVALAPVPVGIDLERDTPTDALALAQAWFTPAEQLRLARGDDDFLSLWTAKEAVLKAQGAGLSADPLAFTVPARGVSSLESAASMPAFQAVLPSADGAAFDGYRVARLALDACAAAMSPVLIDPYRAAVAVHGNALPVTLNCADAASIVARGTLRAIACADALCAPH